MNKGGTAIKKGKLISKFFAITLVLVMIMGMLGSLPAFVNKVEASPATEIWDWYDLDAIRNNLASDYIIMNDLDSTAAGYTELASPTANQGKGWQPIGNSSSRFTGTFDGQGYEIRDLFISRPEENHVGLFGDVTGLGLIKNVWLADVNVTGNARTGSLVGFSYGGTINDSYVIGTVTGWQYVGGLVGESQGVYPNDYSRVQRSHFTGSVSGSSYVGGLVGYNHRSYVIDSHCNGNVTGDDYIGGLVGRNYYDYSFVSNSYSTASVTGSSYVGGLVGDSLYGTVYESYANGDVTADWHVGGLVGTNAGSVSSSYSTANVVGSIYVGGLVGTNIGSISNSHFSGNLNGSVTGGGLVGDNSGTVDKSYSTGIVTGSLDLGGLVGDNQGTVTNSFWDINTSGTAQSDGGTGKTTTAMQDIATFEDTETEGLDEPWDIFGVVPGVYNPYYTWNIVSGNTYPFFSWRGHPVPTVTTRAATAVAADSATLNLNYDFDAYGSGSIQFKYKRIVDTTWVFTGWQARTGIGSYSETINGLSSSCEYEFAARLEYDVEIVEGDLETFTTAVGSSEYDLTISSTTGGCVTTPGEGTFTYYAGTIVNLVAEPEEDYEFINWTGDVDTTADVEAPQTTITMNNNYEITANFAEVSAFPPSCFIATAAYGTPIAEEIQILRDFRDEYLLTNPVGQALVDFYYKVSPPMAEFITDHPSLKQLVRAGLVPAVAMSTIAVNITPVQKMSMVGLLVLVSVSVTICVTRRRGRSPKYIRG